MPAEFCDTNVLVYAYDLAAGAKREEARRLVERLWDSGDGAISIQVLQELFVSLTRKVARPMPVPDAREIVADLATWQVVVPTADDVLAAIDGAQRWQVSFWDAMVLNAARKAGAEVLWSEDLNDGQAYDGTVVRNPFRAVG
jgi:predicted nucleic acid-binding protein